MVEAWLTGSSYAAEKVVSRLSDVGALIASEGEPTDFAVLVAGLRAAMRGPVQVSREIVPAQRKVAP